MRCHRYNLGTPSNRSGSAFDSAEVAVGGLCSSDPRSCHRTEPRLSSEPVQSAPRCPCVQFPFPTGKSAVDTRDLLGRGESPACQHSLPLDVRDLVVDDVAVCANDPV